MKRAKLKCISQFRSFHFSSFLSLWTHHKADNNILFRFTGILNDRPFGWSCACLFVWLTKQQRKNIRHSTTTTMTQKLPAFTTKSHAAQATSSITLTTASMLNLVIPVITRLQSCTVRHCLAWWRRLPWTRAHHINGLTPYTSNDRQSGSHIRHRRLRHSVVNTTTRLRQRTHHATTTTMPGWWDRETVPASGTDTPS